MISLFRSASELMVQYAHYHRDRRNIVTHLVGIPLIVLSIGMLLSLVSFDMAGNTLSLAGLLWVLSHCRGHKFETCIAHQNCRYKSST